MGEFSMSKYFQLILDILQSKTEHYEDLHPEINDYRTYSISTLSHRYGIREQVNWKLSNAPKIVTYESPLGHAFLKGRAIHEFIQNRLSFTHFTIEFPVSLVTSTFNLTGHCDVVDFENNHLIELKTTIKHIFALNEKKLDLGFICKLCGRLREDKIHDPKDIDYRQKEFALQAGTYARLLSRQKQTPFKVSIFIINDVLKEYELTSEEIILSYNEILERAKEVYKRLGHKRI